MIDLTLTDQHLLINVRGWYKLWALKSGLKVPLEHIISAAPETHIPRWNFGLRCPGTHLPGVITAGSYYRNWRWEFWLMRHRDKMLRIELRDERYATLYLEVENPAEVASRIESAAHPVAA